MANRKAGKRIPRERWLKHRCIAPGCDALFYSTRMDHLTCSAKCRQRYKRHCDKITREQLGQPAQVKPGAARRTG